jgi:tetratricopeptide (TPR) repeat protein
MRRSTNLEAWLLHGEALAELWTFTHNTGARVRQLSEAARDLDPTWPDPWTKLAWAYWWEAKEAWISFEEAVEAGTPFAEKAVELDPRHPSGHNQLGNLAQLAGDHERAVALREKGARLAPSDFGTLFGYGRTLLRAGHAHESSTVLNSALHICPRPPAGLIWAIVEATLATEGPAAAVTMVDRMDSAAFRRENHYAIAAIVLAAVGRLDDARRAVSHALQLRPTLAASGWRRAHADYLNQFRISEMAELLVAAGLPRGSSRTEGR